ncbi:MAG: hypothetical protein EOP45_00325 [Sphingobacteriaceae bacterium]|nr:MAG: hypothetical protein EOP45_00325 [Sphingobacteriaceae bacterium]
MSLPFPLPYKDALVLSVLEAVTKLKRDMVTGMYVFTLKDDGRKYVGRSGNITSRLRAFTGAKAKQSMRTIDQLMTRLGPSALSLEVYLVPVAELERLGPMTDAYRDKIILAMEQFFMLHHKAVLNDMLVVGGELTKYSNDTMELVNTSAIYGSKPLYVYNADKTCLLYIDSSRLKFATDMGISYKVIWKSTVSPLLGKYFFMDEPIDNATTSLMTLDQMRASIKALYLSSSGPKHAVTVTDLRSPERTVLQFTSKAKALQYTVSQKRGKTFMANLPCTHNGWLVEFVE